MINLVAEGMYTWITDTQNRYSTEYYHALICFKHKAQTCRYACEGCVRNTSLFPMHTHDKTTIFMKNCAYMLK